MPDHHVPKQVLFGWLPRHQPPGGPKGRQRDVIHRDLAALNVPEGDWFEEATASRASWRAIYHVGMDEESSEHPFPFLHQLTTQLDMKHVTQRSRGISVLRKDESQSMSREVL